MQTVGELKELLKHVDDDTPLTARVMYGDAWEALPFEVTVFKTAVAIDLDAEQSTLPD